ncbi:uncharacterized protein LOC129988078 isoform X2 [Argiope bruennichi]|nr:uncharacterized protein LOC129988078 isoform X2 [Argiope bruennichi]
MGNRFKCHQSFYGLLYSAYVIRISIFGYSSHSYQRSVLDIYYLLCSILILFFTFFLDGYVSAISHGIIPSHLKPPYILLKKINLCKHNSFSESERTLLDAQQVSEKSNLSVHQRDEPNGEQFSESRIHIQASSEGGSDVRDQIKHIHVKTASKKICVYCKFKGVISHTKWQCQGCNRHLCKKGPERSCFQLSHSPSFKGILHSKMPDSRHVSKISLSPSKTLDSEHVPKVSLSPSKALNSEQASKVSFSPTKASDSEHSSNVFPSTGSLDSIHISKSLSASRKSTSRNLASINTTLGDKHILISCPYKRKRQCAYCKVRGMHKCRLCDLHFCNVITTGRKCFYLYHSALKNQSFDVVDISSDEMSDDIHNSLTNSASAAQISDNESLNVQLLSEIEERISPKTDHIPLLVEGKNVCFYCKVKKSSWCCKTCGKSLCVQKTGKTCFYEYHSLPKKMLYELKEG